VIDSDSMDMLRHLLNEARASDPVKVRWTVPEVSEGRVWCDASSLVIRVSLEIGGAIVEDASWLRKENDPAHIKIVLSEDHS
jgi:hypothetical protein